MALSKQTKMKTSRKERRKKFDKWIDKSFLSSQWKDGKISKMNFYMPGSNSNYVHKRKKHRCSICRLKFGTGWFKHDGDFYCEEHTHYVDMRNVDRRIEGTSQSKNHPDYQILYQIKWEIKFYVKNLKQNVGKCIQQAYKKICNMFRSRYSKQNRLV